MFVDTDARCCVMIQLLNLTLPEALMNEMKLTINKHGSQQV